MHVQVTVLVLGKRLRCMPARNRPTFEHLDGVIPADQHRPSFSNDIRPRLNMASTCGASMMPLAPSSRSSLSQSRHRLMWLARKRRLSATWVIRQTGLRSSTRLRKIPWPAVAESCRSVHGDHSYCTPTAQICNRVCQTLNQLTVGTALKNGSIFSRQQQRST